MAAEDRDMVLTKPSDGPSIQTLSPVLIDLSITPLLGSSLAAVTQDITPARDTFQPEKNHKPPRSSRWLPSPRFPSSNVHDELTVLLHKVLRLKKVLHVWH